MRKKIGTKTGLAAIALAAVCGGGWAASNVLASDHFESPLVKMDAAQDITDLYVFESAPGKVTIIVCWAGFKDLSGVPSADATYDSKALYTIHVDNNADNVADIEIYWRYGVNAQDQFGVQWEGIPGVEKVSGAVETIFQAGQFARVWTGHADDPFFFDAQGYLETIGTGTVSFMNTRDFLAGLNVTAAAIEIDTDTLGGGPIQVWATASRLKN
jgi:hypothetical protein